MFDDWLEALEARHLADLRVQEVTRALRALSSSYVQRRQTALARGAALDTRGKRAAFALFYAPLHFLIASRIVEELGAPAPTSVLDLGCGTGAVGAAWAHAAGEVPVLGLDRHQWAVEEARWTYRQLGLRGAARQADIATWGHGDRPRVSAVRPGSGVIAGYVLNELPTAARERLEKTLLAAAERGVAILVLEPIARSVTPWWDETAQRFVARGGRADQWRFRISLPPMLRMLDRASGLDHQELTARSLYVGTPNT